MYEITVCKLKSGGRFTSSNVSHEDDRQSQKGCDCRVLRFVDLEAESAGSEILSGTWRLDTMWEEMLDDDPNAKSYNLALKPHHLSLPSAVKTGYYAFVFYRNICYYREEIRDTGSSGRLADL